MRYRNAYKHRTRKACAYAFVLTVCVLLTGIGLLMADCTTGRTLHGSDYSPTLPATDDQWTHYLPPRTQVLLRLTEWEQKAIQWVWEQTEQLLS